MSNKQVVTGTLQNWYPVLMYEDMYQINGDIYGDSKQRFPDGTFIHTSIVNEGRHPHAKLKEGDIIHTTYSAYKLGKRAQP